MEAMLPPSAAEASPDGSAATGRASPAAARASPGLRNPAAADALGGDVQVGCWLGTLH
jgi:hypothetical protein